MKRRKFSRDLKISILNELQAGKSGAQICREHNIGSCTLYKWKHMFEKYPDTAFKGNGNSYTVEAKLAESQRLIGKLYAENELLKKANQSLQGLLAEHRKRGGHT